MFLLFVACYFKSKNIPIGCEAGGTASFLSLFIRISKGGYKAGKGSDKSPKIKS